MGAPIFHSAPRSVNGTDASKTGRGNQPLQVRATHVGRLRENWVKS